VIIKKGTCILIDVAISEGKTVIKKEAENILKYKDVTVEIQHMWHVKTKRIPVIMGATVGLTVPVKILIPVFRYF
jgi:hypothetical protein